MIFDRNENKPVIALLGAGSMGTAIARRIAAGKKILLGDISEKNLERVCNELTYSGYDVETCVVNALDKASVEAFAWDNLLEFVPVEDADHRFCDPAKMDAANAQIINWFGLR